MLKINKIYIPWKKGDMDKLTHTSPSIHSSKDLNDRLVHRRHAKGKTFSSIGLPLILGLMGARTPRSEIVPFSTCLTATAHLRIVSASAWCAGEDDLRYTNELGHGRVAKLLP